VYCDTFAQFYACGSIINLLIPKNAQFALKAPMSWAKEVLGPGMPFERTSEATAAFIGIGGYSS
jgi:hypothetical protein